MSTAGAAYQMEIRGHEELIAQLEAGSRNVKPAMMAGMTEATALVMTTTVTRYLSGPPGLNRRTARLATGIDTDVRDKGTTIEGVVGTNVEHGAYLEQPEGPGVIVIRPRIKKVLAFVTRGQRPETPAGWKAARAEGRVVYARQVTLRRKAFLEPSLTLQRGAVEKIFENKLTRLVGGE